MDPRRAEVAQAQEGWRLDRVLAEVWPDHSRSFWQRQIAAGNVTVEGRQQKKGGYLLKAGQLLLAQVPEEPRERLVWENGAPFKWPDWVLYYDQEIIVINKPRGLTAHPSPGHWNDSVVHRLWPWLSAVPGDWRPGVVHRLDRDTSGAMVLARTARARELLSQAIQERQVQRDYLAVVRGHPTPPLGTIEAPIGRDPAHRLKMALVLNGRFARTHYRTVASWAGFSLLACRLDTGRTHQIRVHLASWGHPVLGDTLYGGGHPLFSAGQLLHAGRLRFQHPMNSQLATFFAPVPQDWGLLARLGPAQIESSYLFDEDEGPLTQPWLTQLGVASASRSS